ncbi:group-specific protein [Lysinibacillus agricola]|uniref:group-specific protein n=1 Tax=Lysinibacillus agricola TaxID=2590012 RepID=UPI003C1987E9
MNEILSISLNKKALEDMIKTEIKKRLSELETDFVFWDLKELSRRTNMSIPFIKEYFFYNEDFPKYKVGTKWLMPAKETEKYLLNWLKQQPRS